jgi:hypothetical protein
MSFTLLGLIHVITVSSWLGPLNNKRYSQSQIVIFPQHKVYKKENVRFTTPMQQLHNNPSHEGESHTLEPTLMWGWAIPKFKEWYFPNIRFIKRKILDLQHEYNNCTTIPHMKVGPTHWSLPSCEELLWWCSTRIKSLLIKLI